MNYANDANQLFYIRIHIYDFRLIRNISIESTCTCVLYKKRKENIIYMTCTYVYVISGICPDNTAVNISRTENM